MLNEGLEGGANLDIVDNLILLPVNLVPQSEQQLVDCAQAFNNHGCAG